MNKTPDEDMAEYIQHALLNYEAGEISLEDAISELKALVNQQWNAALAKQWISVEDRLPELSIKPNTVNAKVSDDVLCLLTTGEQHVCWYNYDLKMWIPVSDVKLWQPLPAAPILSLKR